MSDGRGRRRAKQVRRDMRRTKARDRSTRDEASLVNVVRGAPPAEEALALARH